MFAILLGVATFAGCGGGDASKVAQTTARPQALPDCTPIEPGTNDRFLLCRSSGAGDRGSFRFRGRGPIPITYPYPGPAGHWSAYPGPAGHWSGAFLSPDAHYLLLQWIAECEVPFALLVPARGGTPRFVFDEQRIEDARPSIAHGWTSSGEAIVEVVHSCSDAAREPQTEIWLVSPGSEKRRLRVAVPK